MELSLKNRRSRDSRPIERSAGRRLWLAFTVVVFLVLSRSVLAGGGPENVFLLVNANSEGSQTIANYYIALRGIPPSNVLYIDWKGSLEACSGATFREQILKPAVKAIEDRRLAAQIDYVVYSSDFPWRIELQDLFPEEEFPPEFRPIGSLTGVTYLFSYLVGEKPSPALVMPSANWYVPNPTKNVGRCADLGVVPSRGFRFRYAWDKNGVRTQEDGAGQRYFLSTALGITQGRGNSVDEIISYLTRGKAADGKRPRGTVYFMRNSDIRSQVRHECFDAAAAAVRAAGVQARVLQGKIPTGAKDVMGIMAGAESFDVAAARNTILPGAICEHLTSAGGNLSANYQTPLSHFLRAGAAGASGTVAEPRAVQAKFPLPTLHVHYARGCSLAEAFYQSVAGPYQILIVGDPLCQPWAVPPTVSVDGIKSGQVVSGGVTVTPGGAAAPGRQLGQFELMLDGRLVARLPRGQSLSLDTANIPDGSHELRFVAANADAIETQGRIVVPFTVKNDTSELSFEVTPSSDVPREATLKISARQSGAAAFVIRQNSREIGRIEGEEGTLEISAATLGGGPTSLQAASEGPAPAISPPVPLRIR